MVFRKMGDGSKMALHRAGEYTINTRPKDNLCTACGKKIEIPKRKTRIFRFCSETLPGESETVGADNTGESTEVRNSVYPAFKKWLPAFLIKKDITARKPSITLFDPNHGQQFGDIQHQGEDIVVEFVSYSQSVQALAGVQRLSIWCDEEPPLPFFEEQLPRLLAEDGDLLISLTPANRVTWTYDEIFEQTQIYIRTPTICEFLKEQEPDKEHKRIQWTESKNDIAVIQAATDDNPTINKEVIEQTYIWDDPDTIATRRFGLFRAATGRIFSDMNLMVHVIDPKKYFSPQNGFRPPSNYLHARSIDYHERNPWAIPWVALSPENEMFVYWEFSPNPLKWVTLSIAQEIAKINNHQRFAINLIDPLANKVQTNTGTTVIEDLNQIFSKLRRQGEGQGGYWEPFDTKGLKGRDDIRERLKNSLLVEKPFSNRVLRDGREVWLPTMWVFDNCRETIKSLKHWRFGEWTQSVDVITKDRKEDPIQKHSHYCTALEGLLKDQRFRPKKTY